MISFPFISDSEPASHPFILIHRLLMGSLLEEGTSFYSVICLTSTPSLEAHVYNKEPKICIESGN